MKKQILFLLLSLPFLFLIACDSGGDSSEESANNNVPRIEICANEDLPRNARWVKKDPEEGGENEGNSNGDSYKDNNCKWACNEGYQKKSDDTGCEAKSVTTTRQRDCPADETFPMPDYARTATQAWSNSSSVGKVVFPRPASRVLRKLEVEMAFAVVFPIRVTTPMPQVLK